MRFDKAALTQRYLNQMHCSTPGCTCDDSIVYLDNCCHPGGGENVSYDKRTGRIKIECAVCEDEIITIEVAA